MFGTEIREYRVTH